MQAIQQMVSKTKKIVQNKQSAFIVVVINSPLNITGA